MAKTSAIIMDESKFIFHPLVRRCGTFYYLLHGTAFERYFTAECVLVFLQKQPLSLVAMHIKYKWEPFDLLLE